MNGQTITLTRKAEDLLGILEMDIEHIERTIQYLDKLRGFLVRRDERGLADLLEAIQTEAKVYSNNEQHRCQIRREMSILLGYKPETMTLSVLSEHISEPIRTAIAESQRKLKQAVEHLRKEYTSTAGLLSDCTRINSLLLKVIFGRGKGDLVCYDSAGQTTRHSDAAFMSMRI